MDRHLAHRTIVEARIIHVAKATRPRQPPRASCRKRNSMSQLIMPSGPLVMTEGARISNLRIDQRPGSTYPSSMSTSQWIHAIDPFIRVDEDNGRVVKYQLSLPPGSSLANSTYADLARISCAAASTALERFGEVSVNDATIVDRSSYDISTDAACASGGNVSKYWWGVTFYLNHCLCNDVTGALNAGTGAAGIAAAIAGAIPGAQAVAAILGAVAGFLALYSATLTWADAHCDSRGADVSTTWVALAPWVKTIC